MSKKNIAILCSGGDTSGMNPALKYFVEYALKNNLNPYFVYDGYNGLIDDKIGKANYSDVAGIINLGGTIIGSARSERFRSKEYRQIAKKNLDAKNIDMLVVLGGDGSFKGLHIFYQEFGIPFCGIPATIDNDIAHTIYCLGVDTALNMIRISIDAIRDTASSFHRALVVETMGNKCGYLALVSAITSGAEMCLIPEKEYDLQEYEKKFKKQIQEGRKYFLAVVAEGIKEDSKDIAQWFHEKLGVESRVSVLGYIQRGGTPTVYERLMATKFVAYAIDGLLQNRQESVVCFNQDGFSYRSIDEVANKPYILDKKLLEFID